MFDIGKAPIHDKYHFLVTTTLPLDFTTAGLEDDIEDLPPNKAARGGERGARGDGGRADSMERGGGRGGGYDDEVRPPCCASFLAPCLIAGSGSLLECTFWLFKCMFWFVGGLACVI